MVKLFVYSNFLAAAIAPAIIQGVKIAFVGDTGVEDPEYNGYGHLTMKMIDDEGVDLVVSVGDFDYWGRCTETYQAKSALTIESLWGQSLEVPSKSTIKRLTWLDGKYGSTEGWEVGIQLGGEVVAKTKMVAIDGDLFQHHVLSDKVWEGMNGNLKMKGGERDCEGEPWDGPWKWNQFVREHSFDFLGASGNAEVTEAPEYGSPEIWSGHQRYMHELYMERIYNTKRGACHGYSNQTEPGTIEEYGERFSCFYNNNRGEEQFQFLFLGWFQGSNEHTDNGSKESRRQTMEFIEREFTSERSKNVRWRFCIHHMTSAKLSGGGRDREIMVLARITDACRKHGAIIVSGHHHIYSRTKMLKSVGTESGEDPIAVNGTSKLVISEGLTMSITAGMGGYDGACNGNYWNAAWMEKCISRPSDHRGAVIAEFDENDTRIGNFRYMNSLMDGKVVDEFKITSRLPASKPTRSPTSRPTEYQTAPETGKPTRRPTTRTPTAPESSTEVDTQKTTPRPTRRPTTRRPTSSPIVSTELSKEIETEKPTPRPTGRPTRRPTSSPIVPTESLKEIDAEKPTSKPTSKPTRRPTQSPMEEQSRKPTSEPTSKTEISSNESIEIEKEQSDGVCLSVLDLLCDDDRFSKFCELIQEFDLVNSISTVANDPLTVFAPTNEAFDALNANEVFGLDVLTDAQLVYVLLYHVINTESSVLTYDGLTCNALIGTANGRSTRTMCLGGEKYQRGPMQMENKLPQIIVPDVEACNGVIHVLNNVILPNLDKMPSYYTTGGR